MDHLSVDIASSSNKVTNSGHQISHGLKEVKLNQPLWIKYLIHPAVKNKT